VVYGCQIMGTCHQTDLTLVIYHFSKRL